MSLIVIYKLDVENPNFYEHGKPREVTKKRLITIAELCMKEVGVGQFGMPDVVSGFISK